MELVYKNEKTLFLISAVISITVWLLIVVGTLGIALVYLLFFFISYLFVQSAFISYIKGTAVEITPEQMPELYQRIVDCCQKLNIKNIPDVYMLNGNGILNAMATRFLGRHYLILFSDVVDALDAHPGALNFYIGHELGHIDRKHLRWGPILAPSSMLPLLGAAYSRAREYSCDTYGQHCSENPADAALALGVLAAGTKKWSKISHSNYALQTKRSGGFWMSFHELISDYPWLVKRMERVLARVNGDSPKIPRRNPFAWFLALFVPRLGIGGGGAAVMVYVAIIGVLAAIAIPQYQSYQTRANAMAAVGDADTVRDSITQYIIKTHKFPDSLASIGVSQEYKTKQIAGIELSDKNQMVVTLTGLNKYTIIYTPYIEDGKLYWDCTEGTLPANSRPKECQN